jgi:drug/metabolite transporter (DMT)-like permease
MTVSALALVIGAAVIHAGWNTLAKRAEDKLLFVWWTAVVGSILLLPAVGILAPPPQWTPSLVFQTALAAVLRAAYFLALTAAYSRGDLSLVYPLARGVAPILAPLLALLVLREPLGASTILAITCVATGVYVAHAPRFARGALLFPFRSLTQPHARFALLTGGITAVYSVVDKWSLTSGAPAEWYAYLTIPVAGLLLTPLTWRHRTRAFAGLRRHAWAITAVAIMMPSAYLLVLYALRTTPVSVVAPARELSVVFAVFLGAAALREPQWRHRLVGALFVVAGVTILSCCAR